MTPPRDDRDRDYTQDDLVAFNAFECDIEAATADLDPMEAQEARLDAVIDRQRLRFERRVDQEAVWDRMMDGYGMGC
jgi:hypothetical protein